MKEYYVYGLIDPRTNSIFYIGKGKGKRMFQHSSEKLRVHSNTDKLQIIEEIHKDGLEVTHIIISENLNEEAALLLERLLIHRFGRRIFEEGTLSNIVPGGKWSKESSYFIKPDELPNIDTINTKFPELLPALEKYPHVAKEFNALQHLDNLHNNTIYEFEIDADKSSNYEIDAFIQKFNLGYALEVLNGIKNTAETVYAFRRFWQKIEFSTVEDISKIPFQDFDIIDFKFVKSVNEELSKGNDFLVTALYPNGGRRTEINYSSSLKEISLLYFFPDESKKHSTKFIDGKLDGTCLVWYPSGELKEETIYSKGNKLSQKSYYPNGELEKILINHEDGSVLTSEWFQNGQIQRKTEQSANFIPKLSLNNPQPEIGYLMTWDYSETGILLKETKASYPNGFRGAVSGYEKIFFETGEIKREIDYAEGFDKKSVKTVLKDDINKDEKKL